MTVRQLHHLLRGLDDNREVVLDPSRDEHDLLRAVWRTAEDEARAAYAWWAERRGRDAYVAYRAAADRADAALEALSAPRLTLTPATARGLGPAPRGRASRRTT